MHDVIVAYCYPLMVMGPFMQCMGSLLLWDRDHGAHIASVLGANTGPRVAAARNDLVQAFLDHESKAEWLFMVDADMTFDADVVEQFLKIADPDEFPILGGVAYSVGWKGEVKPCFYVWREQDGETVAARPHTWPDDKLLKVDITGAACLFVHRSVLERIAERHADKRHRWFAEVELHGRDYGEDVTFCIRAANAGASLYIVPWLEFGHAKGYVYGTPDYVRYRTELEAKGEEQYTYENLRRANLVSERAT